MSTFAVSVDRRATQASVFTIPSAWQLAVAIVVAQLALLPAFYSGWLTWTRDPLRSVGILFPCISVLFVLRGWHRVRQPLQGTAWGLAPVVAALLILWVHQYHALHLYLFHSAEVDPLPVGFSIMCMGAGIALLVGGTKLLRALVVPIFLLGVTNPVPHVFSHLDLPLQAVSSNAARTFALLIGEHPTGTQLQLMFTPNFGMFIAPGCNGIRGAVTLGYLALFAALWRGFTARVCLVSLVVGVAVGYAFNLLRLITLVLYYKAGQSFPSIQPYGTQVDYAIGGILFLIASYALGSVVFHRNKAVRTHDTVQASHPALPHGPAFTRNMAVLMLLCAAPACINVHAFVRDARVTRLEAKASEQFPQRVGSYHLVRRWNEFFEPGTVAYHWASYSDGNPSHDISLGLWILPGEHDARDCHAARGESLSPQPGFVHTTTGAQFRYVAYSYNNGTDDVLLASSLCEACQPTTEHRLGPLRLVATNPVVYFQGPHPHTAVLVHTAPEGTATSAELRQPVDSFLSFLDETAFLVSDTPAR